jgi:hypothetical protein
LEGVKKLKPPTTEPQPVPVAELRREGRLARIAKALASGATVTDIAEAEGIGHARVQRSELAGMPADHIRVREP